ncbi:hypothetical protein SAMN04487897_10373 [Paenibacillus sp. yr247]|uniref:hypothetical protein n=1 Tax=Paenibacillus sp. yr247 TaxID=1761880 RepID=UPI00088E632A|nr:hypothetical protein [Paenibacillus sp. yr247]SDN52897.1 hypothetical protein SAMN04487897_10373 [Paenibacillus sp. yr247]
MVFKFPIAIGNIESYIVKDEFEFTCNGEHFSNNVEIEQGKGWLRFTIEAIIKGNERI